MLDVLHWLPFQQRIIFRIGIPWSGGVCVALLQRIPARSLLFHPGHQRSQFPPFNKTGAPFVCFSRTSTIQTRSFSVVGPSVWNGLPLAQRLLPIVHSDTFYSSLTTVHFNRAGIFIHSFVTSIYIATLQVGLLRGAPNPSTTK